MNSLDCIKVYFSSNGMGYYSATPICPIFMSEIVTFFVACMLRISYSFCCPAPYYLYFFILIIFKYLFLFSLGTIFP